MRLFRLSVVSPEVTPRSMLTICTTPGKMVLAGLESNP